MSVNQEIEEIKRLYATVADTIREPTVIESLQDLLHTVVHMIAVVTKSHPELGHAITCLQRLERSLRVSLSAPEPATLASCDTEFYTLLEAEPKLKSIYMSGTEIEFIDLVTSRLGALKDLAEARPLAEPELEEVAKLEALLRQAEGNLKEYTAS